MDVIALVEAGFENTVASMGTALTEAQAAMMKRMVDKVYISYDGDLAGQNNTMRGLDILKRAGLEVRVVNLPDGLDPDELIRQRGKAAHWETNRHLPSSRTDAESFCRASSSVFSSAIRALTASARSLAGYSARNRS